ncbi:MAG: hypothetical protein LUD68_04955, partial [Rikenellaceae bacterium]|nr:hypothetical protein [Rikenellaceae bacterium]
LLAALPVFAQSGPDTVFQKREIIIIDEDDDPVVRATSSTRVVVRDTRKSKTFRKQDDLRFFNSISLGYNGLVEGLSDLKLPEEADWMDLEGKSVHFNLSLVHYQHNFTRHFGLRTGLELEVNNFRFSRNITPVLSENGNWVEARELPYPLKKSKLVNSYFNVPLVASVGLGNRNRVELYGGMIGGWRWNSYTKLKSSEHGKKRYRDDLNLRNFHYGYTAGVFVSKVGVYATYYPHSIFQVDKGPEVRQVNIGVTLRC